MRRTWPILVLLLFSVLTTAVAADDPFAGTWKMNLAKSKYKPGPPPKSNVYQFSPVGTNGVKLIADGVDANQKPNHREYTAYYDGKDYPVSGNPDADSVALRRIDSYTVEGTQRKNGKLVRTFRRSVSKNSKTLTVTEKLTTSDGKISNNTIVYDKQ